MDYKLDSRTAEQIAKYHNAVRNNVPWVQTLLALMLTPLFVFVSRFGAKGRKNIPDGGYIVVANHHSYFDPIYVALTVKRRIRFMGKSDLFNDRWGKLLGKMGAFPVRRGAWDTDAFETAKHVVTKGRVMCMFPEGGIHPEEVAAKSGVGHIAHLTGATIVPVYLDGARKMYKPWRFPKVKSTIGEPFQIEKIENPTREQSQVTAQRILDAVYDLSE